MKKIFTFFIAALICSQIFAGGILTNTNQSTHFVRMLSRNASTSIDAVYFNPAGLVRMDDGFYFALHNQTVLQDKTLKTTFPGLNKSEFVGEIQAPFFPTFFAAYKKDKLALSLGFGPNSGGASAEFNDGLPSFEQMLYGASLFVPGSTGYTGDVYFKGASVFWGTQLNASYAINDIISVSAGLRVIMAKNTYEGSIKNHTAITPAGNVPLIPDTEIEAIEKGLGFTPILGVNLSPNDKLNIGIKYEFNTKLELTQSDVKDDMGLQFDEDSTYRSDIPAILAIGISYDITEDFRASVSFNSYFDKQADRSGIEDSIDNNMWEVMIGLEYDLSEKLTLSGGFMRGVTGVNDGYQTDLSYSNSATTFGFGGKYNISEQLSFELGVLYAIYDDHEIEYPLGSDNSYKTTYDKTTLDFAIGVNYKF